jgi:hypothetical protein
MHEGISCIVKDYLDSEAGRVFYSVSSYCGSNLYFAMAIRLVDDLIELSRS